MASVALADAEMEVEAPPSTVIVNPVGVVAPAGVVTAVTVATEVRTSATAVTITVSVRFMDQGPLADQDRHRRARGVTSQSTALRR